MFDVGDLVTFTVSFTNRAGEAADPTTVIAKVSINRAPATSYTYGVGPTIVRDSLGVFHVDVIATAAGTIGTRFEGTGAVVAAVETAVSVAAATVT